MPENSKQKAVKQNVKGKTNTPPIQILSGTSPNPANPIIEDVSDNQLNNKKISNTSPLAENVEDPTKVNSETPSTHNPTHEKEKSVEDPKNRENPTVQNTRAQTEK